MTDLKREDVLALAVRADRCGQKNTAANLYAVAELMSVSGDKYTRRIGEVWTDLIEGISDDGCRRMRELAESGASRANISGIGIGVSAGRVS